MEYFDLQDLSNRLDIPVRQLKYVLSEKLVPIRHWMLAEDSSCHPKQFDFITAVFIGCSASMLGAGVHRDAVRTFMQTIGLVRPTGRNSLNLPILGHAITGGNRAVVQIADGVRVRWRHGNSMTDWIKPGPPLAADKEYVPQIILAMDVGLIRDRIRRNKSAS